MGKKILMLAPTRPITGGMEFVVRSIVNSELRDKIFFLDSSYPINYYGFSQFSFKKFFSTFRNLFRFFYFLVSHRKDIKAVYLIFPITKLALVKTSFFVLIASLFNKKTIVHYHSRGAFYDVYKKSSVLKQLAKWFVEKVDKIIILWPDIYKKDLNPLKVKKEKVEVVPNGIKVNEYFNSQNSVRGESVKVLFMGRLIEEKGLVDLLVAFDKLVRDFSKVKLFLVGDPDSMDRKVKQFLQSRKKNSSIFLTGELKGERKRKLLSKTNIFVLPSYREGFSISILEAMASGNAIVCSDQGTPKKYIEEGENGFIVEAKNQNQLYKRLAKLLKQPDLIGEMAINNMELVKKFSKKKFIKKISKVMDSV